MVGFRQGARFISPGRADSGPAGSEPAAELPRGRLGPERKNFRRAGACGGWFSGVGADGIFRTGVCDSLTCAPESKGAASSATPYR
jgi:hypothetical protein